MVSSAAVTVEEYLAELPPERAAVVEHVRELVLDNVPDGIVETMNWGMIAYEVPISTYPDTYNGQPLSYAALASQKNHMALYLSGIYMDEKARAKFESDYKATGKRFDVGKSCVRFRKLDDLPLPVIAEAIAYLPADEFVERVKAVHSPRKAARKK